MMSIPQESTVLVIGGGPAGAYAACALAREEVSTVLLESDVFPRYHVGESMLASLRQFLQFIYLDSTFKAHGFTKKVGITFAYRLQLLKLCIYRRSLQAQPKETRGMDRFIAAGGPEAYTWNVVRSEADDLTFRHAGKCGAKIFDGVKVESIEFTKSSEMVVPEDSKVADIGRPVSATWKRQDGTTGSINFDYLIDASGRHGLVSTKYMKNCKYNQGLKNVASWAYWSGTDQYAMGTDRQNQPFFEALTDASGWAWCIPLHNGTMSVGIVMRHDLSIQKKKALGSPSTIEFYKESLKLVPNALKILGNGQIVTDLKQASDWSYSASAYASPYLRIAGDAGCFIDPYFSSGVHLAYASGLSAAMTICAARNGDCNELAAAKWHSSKVAEGYTRFLLVVMSAMKQIRGGDEPVLSDWDDDGFDVAFDAFRPIIQGAADADVGGKLTHEEVVRTVGFCLNAFKETTPEERKKVLDKVAAMNGVTAMGSDSKQEMEKLTEDEVNILTNIRAKQMLRMEDSVNLKHFGSDAIDGLAPNLVSGKLGLVIKSDKETLSKLNVPVVDLLVQVKEAAPISAAA